jgi:RHH-type transcriptional regulator, proline utilization regulon repressor / proline dehydrogenase / delta 1-pyrroline-5-carboxylate dehydrogenase
MTWQRELEAVLRDFAPNATSPLPLPVQRALFLARRLQQRAAGLLTAPERRQQAELDRLLQHPRDKATLVQLTDQAFRPHSAARSVDQFIHILDVQGVPRCFSRVDRTLLRGFQSFGGYLPDVAAPLVKGRLHRETANVILPAEPEHLSGHLRKRREQGIRMNVNFLGEAILSEPEAQRRLDQHLDALRLDDTEVFSVKISTLFSQVNPLAREHTLGVLCDRLERLLRAAAETRFRRPDGSVVPKFIYLDMEEYRDLFLTGEAFLRTLDRTGLEQARAGMALQAYIPDSFAMQQRVNAWARERVARGGSPVTLRIVKGANMEMEHVEASLHGWPQAPFKSKVETDANFKRMLREGMQPENLAAVRLGIASHNLFDVAYGLVLAADAYAWEQVQFEMLEGMANHQRRALFELCGRLLLYAPVCRHEDFLHAIGYLIRRLDENSGPDNFLRHAFKLDVDGDDWRRLEEGFLKSFELIPTLSSRSRRTQNRNEPLPGQSSSSSSSSSSSISPLDYQNEDEFSAPHSALESQSLLTSAATCEGFTNEPDTDWSLPQNVDWAEGILRMWEPLHGNRAVDIPLVIAGGERWENRDVCERLDPSRPGTVVSRHRIATDEDVDRAVACAAKDPDGWRALSHEERAGMLQRAAHEIRQARADLLSAALAATGKVFTESDPEVSEAVDFVEFYTASAESFIRSSRREEAHFDFGFRISDFGFESQTLLTSAATRGRARGKGVIVVVPPWNFPIAIPCGGVAAALAAGNTVILKPASDAVLPAWILCQCFWRAGVPRSALQFLPCPGGGAGQRLVTHPQVDGVILTGGTETALALLRARPDLPLSAETGGKNATIVTALADRDQAVKHVLHSAFSHAGQKCSATSLLLLEAELYDDPAFQRTLVEAAQSLHVGSAWDLRTKVNPLIRPPAGALKRGLNRLEPGEAWALEPHRDDANAHLWSPAIKWGVQPGSFTHHTELFGPVLGVMRFAKLREAIDLVNATGYGLTSGLESLDDREQEEWRAGIRAGNLYLNRTTVGAIVLRQPFGGMGKSAVGPGLKAGGPNYVAQFMEFEEHPVTDRGRPRPQHVGEGSGASISQARSKSGRAADEDVRGPSRDVTTDRHLKSLRQSLEALARDAHSVLHDQVQHVLTAIDSYVHWMNCEFGREHDHFRLLGQDNLRRYLPLQHLRIRVHACDSLFELFARVAAARAAGCRPVVSRPPGLRSDAGDLLHDLTGHWAGAIEFVEETDAQLARLICDGRTERVRYAGRGRVARELRLAAAATGMFIADAPVLASGRVELLWYLREQSESRDYHRYGNLGARARETRAETL